MAERIILRSPLCMDGLSGEERMLLISRGCHACYIEGRRSGEFVAVISEISG